MIAYCGLNCETCPIHLATLEIDLNLQLKLIFSLPKSNKYKMQPPLLI